MKNITQTTLLFLLTFSLFTGSKLFADAPVPSGDAHSNNGAGNKTAADSSAYRLTEYTIDQYASGTWDPYQRFTFSYSGERGGLFAHNLYPFFRGELDYDVSNETDIIESTEIPRYQKTRTYTAENLVAEELTLKWDSLSMTYANYRQEVFEYAAGLLIKKTKNEWNTSSYVPYAEIEYTHIDGLLATRLERIYYSGAYENKEFTTFSYDTDGNLSFVLVQDWNSAMWEDFLSYTYTYNAEGQCTDIYVDRNNGSGLESWYHLHYTYNTDGLPANYEVLLYTAGTWQQYEFVEIGWDSTDNLSTLVYQSWDGTDYLNTLRYTFSYESFVVSGVFEPQDYTIVMYPNPASAYLNISTNKNIQSIKLFSCDGKLMMDQATQAANGGIVTLRIANLTSGVYVVQLLTDAGLHSAKLLVEE